MMQKRWISAAFRLRSSSPWRLVAVVAGLGVLALFAATEKPYTTWQQANGTPDSANYSALTQINRSNVSKLQVAWTYPTGDKAAYTFQPLVAGRTMFGVAKNGNLVAVDAATGKELWVHEFGDSGGGGRGANLSGARGLNYWEDKDGSKGRILVRAGGFLQAIDAKTGNLVESFGDKGKVDLKTGMTRGGTDNSRSPGQVFDNYLILGSATGEAYGSTPADIRGFDTVTGKLVWSFHTVPHPGEPGYETWPKDAWTYSGGAGNWGEMSIDTKRGIAYVPTGTPKYEFYGGDRTGNTLYGDCVLALDARTGKLLWHYQTIHHDVWEYELVSAPQLLTVKVDGKTIDIVAQASKNGFLYVLDRVTGKPVWPIPEKPVPTDGAPGEHLSPTQPFPTKPPAFERQRFTVNDIDKVNMTPAERAKFTDLVAHARNEGLYTPMGTDYFTIMMPGHSGGSGLFATSADPATGTMYVVSFAQPAIERLYTTSAEASQNIGMALWGPNPVNGNPADMKQVTRTGAADTGEGGGAAPSAAQTGRAMYEQTCQQCHGATLTGEGGGAPSLIGIVGKIGADGVKNMVTQGRGPMPSFANMSQADLNGLVAFLQNPAAAPAGGAGRAGRGGRGGAAGGRGNAGPPPYPSGLDIPPRLYTTYGIAPPEVTPPYSSITAYDLNKGTIKWQIPYGEAVGVGAEGNNFGILKIHGPKARLGVTAGGLAFSATIERKARAFDKDTGKVLWTTSIPDGAEGAPAIYEVDGREYVLFCVRGAYIAYALPAGTR